MAASLKDLPADSVDGKVSEQHSRSLSSSSICRICYGGDEELLITPCLCSGSMRFVHESCLLTWLRNSSTRCEICKIRYKFSKTVLPYKERLDPNITTWHLAWIVKELVVLDWVHFLQTVFICVSHMLINRMASFDLVYQFALIAMIEVCFYGLNIFNCFFLLYYERWARLNVHVRVLNFDECPDGNISLLQRLLERYAKLLRRNRRLNDVVDAIEEADNNIGVVRHVPHEALDG